MYPVRAIRPKNELKTPECFWKQILIRKPSLPGGGSGCRGQASSCLLVAGCRGQRSNKRPSQWPQWAVAPTGYCVSRLPAVSFYRYRYPARPHYRGGYSGGYGPPHYRKLQDRKGVVTPTGFTATPPAQPRRWCGSRPIRASAPLTEGRVSALVCRSRPARVVAPTRHRRPS